MTNGMYCNHKKELKIVLITQNETLEPILQNIVNFNKLSPVYLSCPFLLGLKNPSSQVCNPAV